jgi:hypothetical protein
MAAESGNLLQTFFSRLGFEVDAGGLDEYESKLVGLSKTLLKFSGIASLSMAGLFELTRSSTEGLASVEKLSETYDIATETLGAFNRMGRQVGITAESMGESLITVQKIIQAVAIGQGRFATKALEKYGITVKDTSGKVKDLQTFLGDVAERMVTMTAGERNLLATRLGLDPGMIRLMRNGRDEFNKLYQTASKGLPFKADDYRKAEEFEITFANVKAAIGAMTTEIGLSLMPTFQRALDKFLAWWKLNGEYVMGRIKFWIGLLTHIVGSLIDFIDELTGQTNVLTTAIKALGVAIAIVVGYKLGSWAYSSASALASLAGKALLAAKAMLGLATEEEAAAAAALIANIEIVAIVAAFALLAAAIFLIIDDIQTWRRGGESLFGKFLTWIKSLTGPLGAMRDGFIDAWKQIKAIWLDTWGAIKESLKTLVPLLKALWPIVKVALIAIFVLLGAALFLAAALLIAILAVLGAIAYVGAKIATVVAKIATLSINTMVEQFKDDLAAMEMVFTETYEWLKAKVIEIGAFFHAAFAVLGQVIGDFFMGIVHFVIDEAINLMTLGLSGMIEQVGGTAKSWWEKIKNLGSSNAPAMAAAASATPPSLASAGPSSATLASLSPQQQAAVTMASTANSVNAAQTNSNNTKIDATINVSSPEEATQAVLSLKDKAAKQRQTVGRNAQQTAF